MSGRGERARRPQRAAVRHPRRLVWPRIPPPPPHSPSDLPTCVKSCEMTCWKRSTTRGLGGGGPCPAHTAASGATRLLKSTPRCELGVQRLEGLLRGAMQRGRGSDGGWGLSRGSCPRPSPAMPAAAFAGCGCRPGPGIERAAPPHLALAATGTASLHGFGAAGLLRPAHCLDESMLTAVMVARARLSSPSCFLRHRWVVASEIAHLAGDRRGFAFCALQADRRKERSVIQR